MKLIEWNKDLMVGVKDVDFQHQKLIDMINDLHEAMKKGHGKDILGDILKRMIDYTVYHFQEEEKLFLLYKYPGYEQHKKEHDDLTQTVTTIKEKFEKGNQMLTLEIFEFLRNWLTNHIMGSDKKYGPYLNKCGKY